MIAVGAWSLGEGAGFGAAILRILAACFALQIGYFALLLLSGFKLNRNEADGAARAAQGKAKIIRRAKNIHSSVNVTG